MLFHPGSTRELQLRRALNLVELFIFLFFFPANSFISPRTCVLVFTSRRSLSAPLIVCPHL